MFDWEIRKISQDTFFYKLPPKNWQEVTSLELTGSSYYNHSINIISRYSGMFSKSVFLG